MEGPWDDYKQSSQAATTSQSNNSPSGPWDDYASPEPAQTSPTLQRGSTRFSDYVKAPIAGLVEGVGSGVAGIGSLAKLVSPAHYARTLAANSQSPIVRGIGDVTSTVADAIPNALQYVGGKINSLGQKIEGSESQAAQEGQAQPIVQGQLLHPSTWKLGAGATLPGVVLKGENLIGNIAPMFVAPEAAGAKVLGAAGKAAGELGEAANAVRAGTALSDLSPEVAQAATKLTRNVARAKQVTGAGVGGVQMAEGQAQGEQARIEQMPQDQLEQVPAYQQAIAAGMTPDQARAHVAQNAHDAAFAATLPLAVAQGGISTLPLLNNTQGVLARAVGKSRLARGIAGAALEAPVQGGAFVGQNAADIAAVNATTGEQRSPMEDSLATFGSGAVMGAAFGGIGGLHRPAEPFPGAAPGSLSDAANTLQRAAGPAPEAQGQGAPAGAESKPVTVKAPPPPAPWINSETGDVRTPDGTEVVAALHGLLDQKAAAAQNGQSIMFAPKDVADAWGLPLDRVKTLMRVTANERRAGMTTEQAQQRAAQEAQVADQNAIANPQIAIANPASQDVVGDGKPTDTPSVQSDTAGGSAPDTTSMAAQPEAVAPEGALAQSDLLTNNPDLSDRQRARIAQRVRGGGVPPGLLDAAAEEATAGARAEPVSKTPEPAPPSDNAHLDTQPETPPQGGVSASETPNEEPTHANEQQEPQQSAASATPGGTGRADGSAPGAADVEGGSAAPATRGAAARPAPAAGGETGTRAVDTTGLENALSKTDRATGPDGATYLVKENSNGEGYHFNRMEDGSSTQHRNSDPAQPWNREQAISAAAQMARERSALTATVTPDTAGTKFHSASTGDMQERPTVRAGESGSLAEPAQSGGAAEGNQTLPRADHKAQLAAVQAANDSYLESARIAAVRDRMQEEYDSGQNQHHLSIDTHGLDRDEDGDLTDKGMAEYDHRVAQAIQSAARDAAGKIRSLEDIDHHGTKLQAYNAAKAWLDAQGIHYRELDSAGSRYLEVEAPAGSKADEEGEALKLRFATHEQQTRRHKQTPFNWVQGGGGKPLADILEAARKFARAPVSDASAGADAGAAALKPSAPESAQAGQATAAEPVSQASEAPKASNVAETTPKTPETQAATDTGDAEAAFAKRAAAIAARFRAGEFGANSKRAPEYKQAWLQGYRGEPFPRAGVDDGFIDRAYRAGEVAADYDSGRRTGEASVRAAEPAQPSFRVEPLGQAGLLVHGDKDAVRAKLAEAGFKKRGTPQKGALRFDARDRDAIEKALSIKAEASHAPRTAGVEPVRRVGAPATGADHGKGEAGRAAEQTVKRPVGAFSKPDTEDQRVSRVRDALREIAKGKNEAVARGLRPDLEKFGGDADVHFKLGDSRHGLKHIVEKRGLDTLGRVLRTVALGENPEYIAGKKTVRITHDGTTAVLSLDEHGNRKTWLLTGWEEGKPDASGEVGTHSDATQGGTTFSRSTLGAGLDKILAPRGNTPEKPEGSFSQNQSKTAGIARDRAQQIVNEVTAKWGDEQPRVHVLESADQLPVSARSQHGYKTAEGYRHGKNVYLVVSNLHSEDRVRQVLAHEAVGHYGLERILDEHVKGGWAKFTAAVDRLRNDPSLGSAAMRDAINETERRYRNADGTPADSRTFAEELPAVMAEKGVNNGILRRVVAAVRAFLRKIMPGMDPTEKMIHDLLGKSDKFLHDGERYSDRVARMQAMAFSHQPDTFYSALAESVGRAEGAPKKGTAEQWKQWLDGAQRRGEFKGAEREWMGVDAWLDQHKGEPITRAEVQQFARDNQVRLQEVMHGDEPPPNPSDIRENEDGGFDLVDEAGDLARGQERPTRFSEYTLPGGKNYRELLLTLPSANQKWEAYAAALDAKYGKDKWSYDTLTPEEQARGNEIAKSQNTDFKSNHFAEPNILAHVRFNDRIGPDGEKILHVEEVQSDWHQAGRKQGYALSEAEKAEHAALGKIPSDKATPEQKARFMELSSRQPGDVNHVPDAPFKKEWPLLAMKRVLRYAAEHGYDKVTWTTGEQQAARYYLSKNVDGVRVMSARNADQVNVMVKPKGSTEYTRINGATSNVDKAALPNLIGKELAAKAIDALTKEPHIPATFTGVDLKLGGEGMHAFYDKMLPNELNKYVKQWGAKVGVTQIKTDEMPWTKDRTTVHSVDITPAMRAGVMAGQPMFSRPEQATMDDLDKVMSAPDPDRSMFDKAKAWLGGKGEDLRPAALGLLQTRHVLELVEHVEPLKGYGKQYGRSMQQLDTDRSHLLIGAPNLPDKPHDPKDMLAKGAVPIAQALRDYTYKKGPAGWLGQRTAEGKALFDMMHQATINGMDPDKEYQRLTIENAHGDAIPWTKELVSQRLKLLREQALQRGGDPVMREKITEEKKYLRNIAKMERSREQRWPELVRQWHALPEEAKELYRNTRDWYAQHRDAVEEALVKNIEGYDVPETYRRSLVNRMRLQFEEARRSGVYFPLNRDGDYWISFQDAHGNEGFKMFESSSAAASAELKLKRAGYQINATGRRDPNAKAKSAPPGTFVREVIDILKKAGVSEKTQDAIYQSFLQTLPEMSMRKHSIHRRNIAGFSEDGLRAFAKNSFHGAHQLAKLRHLQDMQTTLEAMQQTVDAWRKGGDEMNEGQGRGIGDTAKADALVGELAKRHQWIMAPTDAQLANHANALGFVWYLGASPASALTNLTQVVQTVLPVLGAQHGWPKATRMLGAAWRDAARTGGHMDRTLTDPDERRAFLVMQQRGDFSKTQAHTLAGLAEGNVLQSSPAWTKTMSALSWMFHTAEVINREATGMAAFRLARARGDDFNKAIEYAGEINAGTNFDYSAANRPRLMQGNAMRIALQFKQYGVGMSWLFYRNLYQAMKGETPEVRRQARRTVTGILGMTALLAGTTGLPIYNGVKAAANAANLAFGDPDQPFDFDTEFHAWLAEHLGQEAANVIATGPVSELTGADIANRTSMSNLFFQNNDQNLEGADAYHALLESLAGPMGGITKNFYVGAQRIREGNVQRGIETMLPTSVKNAVKALRFAHDGANTLRGDPILPDISGPQDFIQALGFTPTKLAQQQATNSALMNFTQAVQERRQTLLNGYAMAVHTGDPDDRAAVMDKIRDFNQQYPAIAISPKVIMRSLRSRAQYSARAQNGVAINPKLRAQAELFAGANQGAAQ